MGEDIRDQCHRSVPRRGRSLAGVAGTGGTRRQPGDHHERQRGGAESGVIRLRHEQSGGEPPRARARGGVRAARAGQRRRAGDGARGIVDVPARADHHLAREIRAAARHRGEHGCVARPAGGVLRQAHAHRPADRARRPGQGHRRVPHRRLPQDDRPDRQHRRRPRGRVSAMSTIQPRAAAAPVSPQSLADRLDAINEFDREPVTPDRLQGPGTFIGLYAGEHLAGTEFVIGPLFVAHGVAAADLVLGLLVGNLLAVLSWAFITAPIATRTRLNLYWHLRKITGPNLLFVYNIVNALMFCFLAGSMISVAATAVGLPLGMAMPKLNDVYPNSVSWVLVVFLVGTTVTALAILGFEKIAAAGQVASPWMFMVFVAAAVAVLPKLGVTSLGDFWRVASERIWTGAPAHGVAKFTFWHIMFFAWFCNMAMHIGMADMTVLRYAKRWQYGFLSACGMYLGHFVAWIASGILCAAALGDVAPGPIAYLGAGVTGAATVVIASWTTANPTLYRAGMALQTITPNWKRWKVTLAAGAVTTAAAIFPALMMRLPDFVALYGLILMPMGAVIFADFWLLPKLGLRQRYAEWKSLLFSWPAALTWVMTLVACWAINAVWGLEIFFLGLPGWFISTVLYVGLGAIQQPARVRTARAEA